MVLAIPYKGAVLPERYPSKCEREVGAVCDTHHDVAAWNIFGRDRKSDGLIPSFAALDTRGPPCNVSLMVGRREDAILHSFASAFAYFECKLQVCQRRLASLAERHIAELRVSKLRVLGYQRFCDGEVDVTSRLGWNAGKAEFLSRVNVVQERRRRANKRVQVQGRECSRKHIKTLDRGNPGETTCGTAAKLAYNVVPPSTFIVAVFRGSCRDPESGTGPKF